MIRAPFVLTVLALLAACGERGADSAAQTTSSAALPESFTAKPQGPVSIDYRIIGTPIVGQPLAIDIEVRSLIDSQPITLRYRINDSTAMELTEAQPAEVSIAPTQGGEPALQQVRLVPLREGRLFLNVAASIAVEDGTVSSAIAIPIQVGAAPRQPEQNGTITTDEAGEAIHSLPASEN